MGVKLVNNSNNKIKSESRSKILATFMVLIIVEAIIYVGCLIRYFDRAEFLQVALGTLVICFVLMPVVYFSSKRNGKGGWEYEKDSKRVTKGINDEGFPFVLIKGDIRNAVSAWAFSFLLLALIVWRWEVDDNITRKFLCSLFFGFISIVCFLIGWCVYRMKIVITFKRDKFVIFKSIGICKGKQMDFSYHKEYKFYVKQVQRRETINVFYVQGNEGISTTIISKLSAESANSLCAYANEQIDKRSNARI